MLLEEALPLLRPTGKTASDRETRFAAWLETLDALSERERSLWVVEDVHWAGPDLLAFLAQAGTATGERLVVATARPSLLETAPEWCEAATLLHLSPLASAATSELVKALVGDALPTQVVEQIARRSDGNPLFVEELLRTWVSVGVLAESATGWRLAHAPENVPLPPTVQSIYAAQLDDLPAPARSCARRASVPGRRFPVSALDRLDVESPHEGLEILSRRALVSGPQSEPPLGPSYSYRHALLRDAGYASLARAERALLHVRFARWLEETPAEQRSRVAELIARHYASALDSAPKLATQIAPDVTRDDC